MPAFPQNYRELQEGEIILATDLICPKGKTRFIKFKSDSKAIGKVYKDVNTPLFQESIIIRLVDFPKINVWCENLNNIPGAFDLIDKLRKENPIFKYHKLSSSRLRNFYILTSHGDVRGENYIGYTNDSRFGAYLSATPVSYPELIKIMGGTLPKMTPLHFELKVSVRYKSL